MCVYYTLHTDTSALENSLRCAAAAAASMNLPKAVFQERARVGPLRALSFPTAIKTDRPNERERERENVYIYCIYIYIAGISSRQQPPWRQRFF